MKCLYVGRGIIDDVKCGGEMYSAQNVSLLKDVLGEENVDIFSVIPYNNTKRRLIDKVKYAYRLIKDKYLMGVNKNTARKILTLFEKERYDFIFVDGSLLGSLVEQIKKENADIEIITFYHNIEYDLIKKLGGIRRVILERAIKYNELLSSKMSDKILLLNKRDMVLFEKYYGTSSKVYCLPMCIEDRWGYENKQPCLFDGDRVKLLFVGANYKPNNEGIYWFIKNVMPNVNAELCVIGKGMECFRDAWGEKLIKIIGTVDKTDSYYIDADVVIEPIFFGGGMKTKTAEALMFGKMILGTNEAFEGYEIDGVDSCVICNKKEDFIKQIKFIERQKKRCKYYDSSRLLYENNHSFEFLKSSFKGIIITSKE